MTGSRTLITIVVAIAVALASFTVGYYGSPGKTYTVTESTTLTTTVTETITTTATRVILDKYELLVDRTIYNETKTGERLVILEMKANYYGLESRWYIRIDGFRLFSKQGHIYEPLRDYANPYITVMPFSSDYTRFNLSFVLPSNEEPSWLAYDTPEVRKRVEIPPPSVFVSYIRYIAVEISPSNMTGIFAYGPGLSKHVATGEEVNATIGVVLSSGVSNPVKIVGLTCKDGLKVRALTQLPVVLKPGENTKIEIAITGPNYSYSGDIHIVLYVEST